MSMATAYGMRRRMAQGGMAGCAAHGKANCMACGGKMAEGGFVEEEKESGYEPMPEEHEVHNSGAEHEEAKMSHEEMLEDLVGEIMAKHYSEGGRVANDTPPIADSEEADYDVLPEEDDLAFHYTGANSGDEIGDEQEDEDRDDVVSMAYRSWKKKDRNPRPA